MIASATLDEFREVARAYEPDRYLAALLAPRSARLDLIVLAAWLAELTRISETVTEPALAAIRLQWWRDAFEARMRASSAGHPLADALNELVTRRERSSGLIDRVFDAVFDRLSLDPDPRLSHAERERLAATCEGAAFELGCVSLGVPSSEDLISLCEAAGVAYGLSRPRPLPVDEPQARVASAALKRARAAYPGATRGSLPAFLPLALVEPYLRGFPKAREQRPPSICVTPLGRVSRLWFAKALRRF